MPAEHSELETLRNLFQLYAHDFSEVLPLDDCSRMMIRALLEPLAPLIADMGDLGYFSDHLKCACAMGELPRAGTNR